MNTPDNQLTQFPTCAVCGKQVRHNVPRLGAAAGFVHAHDGSHLCPMPDAPQEVPDDKLADFARTLERELIEANRVVAEEAGLVLKLDTQIRAFTAQLSSLAVQLEEAKESDAEGWRRAVRAEQETIPALRSALAEKEKENQGLRDKHTAHLLYDQLAGRLITRIFAAADMTLPDSTDCELSLVRLLARLAALEEDKRRLDWLAQQRIGIRCNVMRITSPVEESDGGPNNLRAAIDSALSSENPRTLREGEEK